MNSKGFPDKAILPSGVKDILIEGSAKIRYIEEEIGGIFERWGYKRIRPSLLEYEDILSKGLDVGVKGGFLKFIDPSNGRVVVIRPDITPQIARIVATRLRDWPKPLRLYYNESVLRSFAEPTQRIEEVFQIGAELIGLEVPEADAEIIAMAIESLQSLGLKDFRINIGHVGFLKGVVDNLPIKEEDRALLMKAIALKDRTGLLKVLSCLAITDTQKNLLSAITGFYGGEEVIERGLLVCQGMEAESSLKNLQSILKSLDTYGVKPFITLDLGEARGFNYYTGMVFEGFVRGVGVSIVKGGRYDSLLGKYGYHSPSVGFAFDIEGVMDAIGDEGLMGKYAGTDFLIFDAREDKSSAFMIARYLRSKGFSVAREIIKRDYEASLSYCKKNRITSLLSLGVEGLKEDEIMKEDVTTGKRSKWRIEDFLEGKVF